MTVSLPAGEAITFEYEPIGPRAFSRAERRAIEGITMSAFPDVRRVLPELPPTLVLRVATISSDKGTPETGESGTSIPPDIVVWGMDASRREGVEAAIRAVLRSALFHELAHLARARAVGFGGQLHYHLIQEGLATAIERDYAGGPSPLWGDYPPNVDAWAQELLAMPANTQRAGWFSRHPDGRRWLGSKVGTYLVDRAMKRSGKTSAELIAVPTETLIEMAMHESAARDTGD